MIWRDDDISYLTNLDAFSKVHDIFIKYKVRHTIALVAKDIELAPALIHYINTNNIDVQLHCWEHVDLTENHEVFEEHLLNGAAKIYSQFGKGASTIYPPWNKTDDYINATAEKFGLKVSIEKLSLAAYIRSGGGVKERVVNFHYWSDPEIMLLDPALRIFKERNYKCL